MLRRLAGTIFGFIVIGVGASVFLLSLTAGIIAVLIATVVICIAMTKNK